MTGIDMTSATDLPPPKLEALIEIMFVAAAADGEFSKAERDHFDQSVQSLTNGRISDDELQVLLREAQVALAREGREARLREICKRLPEPGARRVALSLAIQVAAADGIIRTSEREMILDAAEALDIDRDQAADLVSQLSG